jgi:hypothetical protein
LRYWDLGWSVIPCHHPLPDYECSCGTEDCDDRGKHPRVGWAAFQQERASRDQIRSWWYRWPDANIGVITGAISRLVVLDIDLAHGGEASLEELEERFGRQPETVTALTGGGGRHFFYEHPGGEAEVRGGSNYMPGIDIRGDGGLIIAPRSLHASGQHYEWEASSDPWENVCAPMPASMVALMSEKPTVIGERIGGKERFDITEALGSPILEGDRDESLVRLAGHYVAKYRNGKKSMERILEINELLCKPPLKEQQVRKIVDSVLRRQERKDQADREIERRIEDNRGPGGELSANDRLELAKAFWKSIGMTAITDWLLLRGTEPQYSLELPGGEEIALGSNILDFRMIERRILNQLSVTLHHHDPKDWRRKAGTLRELVKVIDLEPTRAADRLEEWIEGFIEARSLPVDPSMAERGAFLQQSIVSIEGRMNLKPSLLVRYLQATGQKIEKAEVLRVLRNAGWNRASVRHGNDEDGFTNTRVWREGIVEPDDGDSE